MLLNENLPTGGSEPIEMQDFMTGAEQKCCERRNQGSHSKRLTANY